MAIRTLLQRIRNVPYSFLDRQDREEKLTFNILVGRHLRDITAAVGGLQIIFAFLAFINLLNPTAIEYMSQTLPNFRGGSVIPNTGHWVQQESPAAFNEALCTFLNSLDA